LPFSFRIMTDTCTDEPMVSELFPIVSTRGERVARVLDSDGNEVIIGVPGATAAQGRRLAGSQMRGSRVSRTFEF
jgi:hypothetical protein